MTMLYSFHENFEIDDTATHFDAVPSIRSAPVKNSGEVHLFAEKLCVPKFDEQILRPRLNRMLSKFSGQFGATLLLGRTGTGKTSLAAEFSKRYEKIAWYSVDSADSSWNVFSNYFAASFSEPFVEKKSLDGKKSPTSPTPDEIAHFVEALLLRIAAVHSNEKYLIVLDNAHYVFDSEWFTAFFTTLVYALSPNTHFLMLSRCEPALPLWRLRSKQVLGVIDEKLLSFNFEETRKYLKKYMVATNVAETFHDESFGRISKLKELAESV